MNKMIDTTSHTFFVIDEVYANNVLYSLTGLRASPSRICASLNSTFCQLVMNVEGRTNFGGGMLELARYEIASLPIVNPELLSEPDRSVFRATKWDVLAPSEERRYIDDVVFDALGLTQVEQDTVCEEAHRLVSNRKTRAQSR